MYTFRHRFRLGDRVRIQADAEALLLTTPEDGEDVRLRSRNNGTPLKDAEDVVVLGVSYATADAARAARVHWRGILEKAFSSVKIGADFGDRSPGGGITEAGRQLFGDNAGREVLNDDHALMVFETSRAPLFASFSAKGLVGRSVDGLLAAVAAARSVDPPTARESLAFDLFSASFSERSGDARLVTLVTAVETLIECGSRPDAVVTHINDLIAQTNASALQRNEIDPLVGALRKLREESITNAGRRLAATLGDRRYMDEEPAQFFSRTYDLRSRLVHGAVPRPTLGEVNQRVGHLELFVGDLLSLGI